ncbi:MAG: TIGR00297 family protein [Haloarculaceae archaeon]
MTGTSPSDTGGADLRISRAAAFAAVGTIALLVPALVGRLAPPLLTAAAIAPFLLLAGLSIYVVGQGRLFDLFARPGDYEEGRLYGLAGYALSIAGLALLTTRFGLPIGVFLGSVLLLAYGNLAQQVARSLTSAPVLPVVAFTVVGALAAVAGTLVASQLVAATPARLDLPLAVFLAVSGALLAALLRSVLFERDDPLVLLSVGLLLWLLADLSLGASGAGALVPTDRLAIGLALAVGFGAVAYAIGAASVTGMLTGVFCALLAVVLGGYGWFAVLIAFFAFGGLSSKFRYEEKLARGVAQENEGARSSGNVLANSAAAVVAVLGFAASARLGVDPLVFLFAFTGSVAAAMSDTFSSEIGGLYDDPRLVTTLRPVDPGTDGAVTWQGEVAGLLGAVLIAAVALPFFALSPPGVAVVVVAGFAGMTIDSVLGATLEGGVLDNQGVNLVATASAAVVAAALAVALGLP